MPSTWIVDITHYLDERGHPAPAPPPAIAMARFFGSIASWTSRTPSEEPERTNVPCKRSRARPPCLADVHARLRSDDTIVWACLACGECGTIVGWRSTPWDRSKRPRSK